MCIFCFNSYVDLEYKIYYFLYHIEASNYGLRLFLYWSSFCYDYKIHNLFNQYGQLQALISTLRIRKMIYLVMDSWKIIKNNVKLLSQFSGFIPYFTLLSIFHDKIVNCALKKSVIIRWSLIVPWTIHYVISFRFNYHVH